MTKFGVVFLALMIGGALWAAIPASTGGHAGDESRAARNERLTALTGAPLYLLLLAIAITVLYIPAFKLEHYLIGFILIPPVLLKMASSGTRFFRYYHGDEEYRMAGPPTDLLRFIVAPLLVLSTVAVFVSGVELWWFGFRFGTAWLDVHTGSSVALVITAGAHLVAHLRRSAKVTIAAIAGGRGQALTGRSLVLASLLIGAALAVASLINTRPFPVS
jgi:hypothetical protein